MATLEGGLKPRAWWSGRIFGQARQCGGEDTFCSLLNRAIRRPNFPKATRDEILKISPNRFIGYAFHVDKSKVLEMGPEDLLGDFYAPNAWFRWGVDNVRAMLRTGCVDPNLLSWTEMLPVLYAQQNPEAGMWLSALRDTAPYRRFETELRSSLVDHTCLWQHSVVSLVVGYVADGTQDCSSSDVRRVVVDQGLPSWPADVAALVAGYAEVPAAVDWAFAPLPVVSRTRQIWSSCSQSPLRHARQRKIASSL